MLLAMGTAPDGRPVEVYKRLPELGEGDIVASALQRGSSVLEFGCGTGRMTRKLGRLRRRSRARGGAFRGRAPGRAAARRAVARGRPYLRFASSSRTSALATA